MRIETITRTVALLTFCTIAIRTAEAQKHFVRTPEWDRWEGMKDVEYVDVVDTNTADTATNGVSLLIATEKIHYSVYEPVLLKLALKNVDQENVSASGSQAIFFTREIYVLNPVGQRRAKTTDYASGPRFSIGGLSASTNLQRGNDRKESWEINRLFDMTLDGEYRIFVRKEVSLLNPERKVMLQTPAITIHIQGQRQTAQQLKQVLKDADIPVAHFGCDCESSGITLHLEGRKVRDVSPLSGFNFHRLFLHNTAVKDLTPLKGCSIKALSLLDSPVTDLVPLEGTGVEWLDLRGTAVTDFLPLTKMSSLKEVLLTGTQIEKNAELCRTLKAIVAQPKNEHEIIPAP